MWKKSQTTPVFFKKKSNRIVKKIGSNMLPFVLDFRIYIFTFLLAVAICARQAPIFY